MGGVKLKNHTVTRGYLAGWKSTGEQGKSGIWYFDLATRKAIFSPSLKAPFAVRKGIYAPQYTAGQRDDRLENWFAESESELCEFARKYSNGRPARVKAKFIKKALSACISMGNRSEYSIQEVENLVAVQNPTFSPDDVRLRALNNCYALAHTNIERFTRGTILILQNVSKPLLTNDQPFWDMSPRAGDFPTACFALTPTTLMIFCPAHEPKAGELQIIVRDGEGYETSVNFARTAAMRMARGWVVCPSGEEANKLAAYLTEETIREAASTDRHLYIEIEGDARTLFQL